MPDPDWERLSHSLYDQVKEYLVASPVPLSNNQSLVQLTAELSFLKMKLDNFPKTRSFDLDEILAALDYPEIVLLTSSHLVLNTAMVFLQDRDLLPGMFLQEHGIFIAQASGTIQTLGHKEIDQLACQGIQAVDSPRIVMQYVYSKGTCPFCGSPVRVDNFITVRLVDTANAGLTRGILDIGDKACFHKPD